MIRQLVVLDLCDSDAMMEYWSIGVLEYWVVKAQKIILLFLQAHHSSTPSLQNSNSGEAPTFSQILITTQLFL